MTIDGLVTFVTSLVDSVTSTCLRSNAGDIRLFSAPISLVSSGTLPDHNSATSGPSAAKARPATPIQTIKENAYVHRINNSTYGEADNCSDRKAVRATANSSSS